MDLEVICGGMITGELQGPIGDKGKYISESIPRLEQMTGAVIGIEYKNQIADGSFYCSSVKPSVAIQWVKVNFPEKAYQFASKIQNEMFILGKNLEDNSTYLSICDELNLPYESIINATTDDEWLFKTNSEFRFCADAGITGFPALVAENDKQLYLVARGYSPTQNVVEILKKIYLN